MQYFYLLGYVRRGLLQMNLKIPIHWLISVHVNTSSRQNTTGTRYIHGIQTQTETKKSYT